MDSVYTDPTGLAYHEAGHAAVLHLRGWLVSVSITPGDEHRGGCAPSRIPEEECSNSDHVLISFAGPVAQWLYSKKHLGFRERADHFLQYPGHEDLKDAMRYMPPDVTISSQLKIAKAFLEEHWLLVRAIAETLLDRGSLDADDVAKLADSLPEP